MQNIFSLARIKLQLSCLPDSLPERDKERQEILEIIRRSIQLNEGTCLCIFYFK